MKRHADRRLPALLLTLGLVGGAGLGLRFWPGEIDSRSLASPPVLVSAKPATATTAAGMARREREIRERFRQGVIMLHAGEHDFAVTAFRRVLQLSPDMPEAHVNMGFAQFGQGHYTVARDFFLTAIDLRPEQANAYWGLAVSLEALCDLPGARGAMRSYLHLSDSADHFVRKAGAALLEWEAAGAEDAQGCISASGSGSVSPTGRNRK